MYYDLDRAIDKVVKQVNKIKIISNNIDILLYIHEIAFIESDKRIIKIHMKDGQIHESYMRLSELYDNFNNFNFAMTHKSFMVNMDMVEIIEQEQVRLFNGLVVPISRKYRTIFKDKFSLYLSGVLL